VRHRMARSAHRAPRGLRKKAMLSAVDAINRSAVCFLSAIHAGGSFGGTV
jgi:hypothetical protein